MKAKLDNVRCQSFSAVRLENDVMRVEVVPALGGKITSIESLSSGRQWLWKNPYLPFREPVVGASHTEEFDSGGWDELFPTVSPCVVSRSQPGPNGSSDFGWGEEPLTDHGELWQLPWQVSRQEVQAAGCATVEMTLKHDSLPFSFLRSISLAPSAGEMTLHYLLGNESSQTLPYLWAAHPLLAVEPGMRIELPAGTSVRWTEGDGGAYVDERVCALSWPKGLLEDGTEVDLQIVPARHGQPLSEIAIKCFADPLTEGWIGVVSPDGREEFRFSFDRNSIPYVGLWMNYGGWFGAGTEPYFNLGIEPTTTPYDSLEDAVRSGMARCLEPKAAVEWSLSLSLSPRTVEL